MLPAPAPVAPESLQPVVKQRRRREPEEILLNLGHSRILNHGLLVWRGRRPASWGSRASRPPTGPPCLSFPPPAPPSAAAPAGPPCCCRPCCRPWYPAATPPTKPPKACPPASTLPPSTAPRGTRPPPPP